MASFDIDIGHGRSLCIEATEKGVDFNSYSPIPSGKVVKVSAKSIHLDISCWKKFNDNIDLITTDTERHYKVCFLFEQTHTLTSFD
jgi:hypothetical protein